MRSYLLIACLTTLVTVPRAAADKREQIAAELDRVQNRIRKLESQTREVPQELQNMESELREAMEEMEVRDFIGTKALNMLDQISKNQTDRLRRMRDRNEDEFFEVIVELVPWLEEMEEMQREDPEMFDLERKSHDLHFTCEQLADKAREAKPEARKRIKADLRQRITELFELRLKMRDLQIKRLETELAEVRRQVENMGNKQQEMIDRRMDQLLNTDDDW